MPQQFLQVLPHFDQESPADMQPCCLFAHHLHMAVQVAQEQQQLYLPLAITLTPLIGTSQVLSCYYTAACKSSYVAAKISSKTAVKQLLYLLFISKFTRAHSYCLSCMPAIWQVYITQHTN